MPQCRASSLAERVFGWKRSPTTTRLTVSNQSQAGAVRPSRGVPIVGLSRGNLPIERKCWDTSSGDVGSGLGGAMRTAVVVVHGVGDPKDGDALAGLMAGLADHGFRAVGSTRVEHRVQPEDRADGSPWVATYPVHRATAVSIPDPLVDRSSRDVVHLHEVYWGDLSRVKGSAIGLLLGLFDLIFGMRHIANASARDAGTTASAFGNRTRVITQMAGQAARAAEHIARGPMLSLNILLAVVAALQGLLGQVEPWLPFTVAHLASFVGPVIVLLAARLVRSALRSRQWSLATINWLIGISGGSLALSAALRYAETRQAFVEAVTTIMSLGALLMALACVAMMVLSAAAVLAAWLARERTSTDGDGRKLVKELTCALVAMNFSTAFGVGLFVLMAMVAWTIVGTQIGPPLGDRITEGLHLFALVWGAFLLAAAVFLVIAWLNDRIKASGSTRTRHRYIVNTWVAVVFLLMSLAYAVLFVPAVWRIEGEAICLWVARTPGASIDRFMDEFLPCVDAWWGWRHADWVYVRVIQPIEDARAYAIAGTLALLPLGAAMRVHVLQAMDLLLDVVAHFQTGLPNRRLNEAGSSTTYPSWDAIISRFRDVLSRVGPVDRVVVVTHSQGTIIALHALGLLHIEERPIGTDARDGVAVDLVTMGSPVDHLYRHYLPRTYRPATLPQGVANWLNLYRRDDYIGTRLKFQDEPRPYPQNVPISPRGHGDYWRDREVLQYLVPFIVGRPVPVGPAQ